MDSAGLSLYADPARQLAVADPVGREMLISCGAALFTARLALRESGYVPQSSILPDPAQPLPLSQPGGGLYPQLLLRMGTTIQTAVGARRPPESVLFTTDGAAGHPGLRPAAYQE